MYRPVTLMTAIFAALLAACAGPAPQPQPGMEMLHWGEHEEMQVASDVDWSGYSKIILHTAPVEFRENWVRDQERIAGSPVREEDLERIRKGVSGQFGKVMYQTLSAKGGYEMTSEPGAGVLRFSPRIVDLDIQETGLVHRSMIESSTRSRGRMTIELVIHDSGSEELLAAAWQRQTDPHEGDVANTSVSNTLAFRRMMQDWADWLIDHLEEVGAPIPD